MHYSKRVNEFVDFIEQSNGIGDKTKLEKLSQDKFCLDKDRKVYYCQYFATRFCYSSTGKFSNTVLSLSKLIKYDALPFIVVLVTPNINYMMLANTTFLEKISHSSKELRMDNIRGSFNGSDIMKEFYGVENEPNNFEYLYSIHEGFDIEENLERLVEATNNIVARGEKFSPSTKQLDIILDSVSRADMFLNSVEYENLNDKLENKVREVSEEILTVAFRYIDNINLRGRVIESLITSSGKERQLLIDAVHTEDKLPTIYTADGLGDYDFIFPNFITATDIKTKILYLASNPKGYNIDKVLSFLATEDSVYLIFIIGIDDKEKIYTRLCSMYNKQILAGTRVYEHWAGRNSRGVAQFDGNALAAAVTNFDKNIEYKEAIRFIKYCLNL